jgi:hypothetical protein
MQLRMISVGRASGQLEPGVPCRGRGGTMLVIARLALLWALLWGLLLDGTPRTGFEAPSRARYGVDPCPRLSGPVGVDAVGGVPSAGEARCAAVAAARGGPGQRVMFPGHGPYLPERCRRLASDVGVSSGLDGEVALAGLLLAGWAPDRGWSRS